MLRMPKIIGGSLEEHRQQTRARIFAAVGELMERADFDDLTFSRIAAEAGVGRTALYNHFPDKDTLLVEFAMHETSSYLERLRQGIAGARDAVESIALYVRTQLSLRGAFHMPSRPTTLAPETAARMREHVVMIEGVLRGILERGMAYGEFARELDVDATVRIVNTLLIGRTAVPEPEADALVAFIVRGLGADPL